MSADTMLELAERCERAADAGHAPPDYSVSGDTAVAQHVLTAIHELGAGSARLLRREGLDAAADAANGLAINAIARVIEMQFVLEQTAAALRARAAMEQSS